MTSLPHDNDKLPRPNAELVPDPTPLPRNDAPLTPDPAELPPGAEFAPEPLASPDPLASPQPTPAPEIAAPLSWRSAVLGFVLQEWQYLLMLVLVLFGVAYTGLSDAPIRGYWMLLTPLIGAICIAAGWGDATSRHDRVRLIWTQALHWVAVLLAMELVYVSDVTRIMTAEASALSVLTVLALGTFTAGVHLKAWKIGLVGVLLALAVPGIAYLERSAMFVLLIVLVAAAVVAPIWWTVSRWNPSRRAPLTSDAEPL
ncbi:hypothetical protein HNR60_004313 [Rhodopseudomonas rhenobacensis]|uniref:Uncharacterized protein n=1 Tax=Rhodopseudomonas rhenobacensis TaxID=87461 RepID=A0A7W8E0W1_9BRAD|nr:hypothetical protein [Rhodopseudomonas rhenobacensis]MBB5049533.1 hypothetical protein [Rhodopseudomonas rhenobacensis]